MSEEIGTVTNGYVTVRICNNGTEFYVNVIRFDGKEHIKLGTHTYSHKRSARRAAIALAKKLDVSYRQDLEYTDTPYTFIAKATV